MKSFGTVTTLGRFKCPDCDAPCIAGENEQGMATILHEMPVCYPFIKNDEPADQMLRRAREKRQN